MVDIPRRPTLSLKLAPKPPETPQAPKASDWKCRPCGKVVPVGDELADEDFVRCPACNARLGLARDFRGETPNLAKVRARPFVRTEPAAPAARDKPVVQVVRTVRRVRRTGALT